MRKNEYYIATLLYFIKMTNQEYIMKYRFNPVIYVQDKFKGINNKDNKENKSEINIHNIIKTNKKEDKPI